MWGPRYYSITMNTASQNTIPFDEEVIPTDLPTHQRVRTRREEEGVRQTLREAITVDAELVDEKETPQVGDLSDISYEESVESGYRRSFADEEVQDEYDAKQVLQDERQRADIRRQHDIVQLHIFKGIPRDGWPNQIDTFPVHASMIPQKGDRLTIDGVKLAQFRKYPKVKNVVRHLGTDLQYVCNANDFVDVFVII